MHVLVHVVKYISNCTLDETFINLENRLKNNKQTKKNKRWKKSRMQMLTFSSQVEHYLPTFLKKENTTISHPL